MMEEIVKKLEEKGYNAEKELALKIYEELNDSRRHNEGLMIALPTILIALLGLLGLRFDALTIMASLMFATAWMRLLMVHRRQARLLKRLTKLIVEDPFMDKNDVDDLVLYITTGSLFIVAVLLLLFH